MSNQSSDEAQVSFHCAATYFSDEEWKLLQEWQKELYRNVMKEIHQALLSLGPLITTTVFSLKAKERLCPVDVQDSERGQRICHSPTAAASSNPDVGIGVNGKQPHLLKHAQGTEGRNRVNQSTAQNIGCQIPTKDSCLKTEEPSVGFMEDPVPEVGESSTNPDLAYPLVTAVYSLSRNNDEKTHYGEDSMGMSTDIVSVHIKKEEEEETCTMDLGNSERKEDIRFLTGHESMNQAKEYVLKYSEKDLQRVHFLGETNMKVMQSTNMDTLSRSQDLPLRGDNPTTFQSGYSNTAHVDVYLGSPSIVVSETCSEDESNLGNIHFPNNSSSAPQNHIIYNVFDENSSLTDELSGHMRTASRERIYTCPECEKHFSQKKGLIAHQRTHLEKKPYPCTFCHKGFNRKDNLDGHIRTHTGEKPYKCTECDKDFTWKSGLIRHQRTHTGS
ncbi:zinc finger protein 615-like isoform X4 [Ambystoma mexicanum]|uniref:zinc finger protein 615-like isoform X4 n=1 Tax=Ambystoma mexicanum TaxID=8296 RepID=UPI0037E786BE